MILFTLHLSAEIIRLIGLQVKIGAYNSYSGLVNCFEGETQYLLFTNLP